MSYKRPMGLVGLVVGSILSLPVGAALEFNLIGQLDPFGGNDRYGDVWGAGDYAYIGSFSGSGVGIIDISDPSTPFLAHHYNPANGQFKDIKIANGIGYFGSDNGGGVHIVDLSTPSAPLLMASVTSSDDGYDSVHNLFVDSGFLYEVDGKTNVVKVFNVSDPSAPFFVRNIETTDLDFVHDVTVSNGQLFTSGFGGRTDIYDVSDIANGATLLGTVIAGANSHSNWVTADGNTLVSAQELSGGDVRIFDVSEPSAPSLLSMITATGIGVEAFSPHNPVIVDDLLFVSWYQAGLQVFDISDPANPFHLGGYDTFPGTLSGFDGNWGVYPFLGLEQVLLSDTDGGLFIIDVSAAVPLPPALAFLGMAIAGLGFFRRRNNVRTLKRR